MKNKTVKMIIAVAVLVVCCGGYAGVKTFVAKQEAKEESEEESEKTSVFTASADDIKSLDFLVDEKETTFEKKDDDWVKKDEEDFPVNQTTLSDAASALTSIESDRVLSDVDDLAEYGLDSPSNTIKITCESEKSEDKETEEKTTTLYVGDKNSSTSQYYVYKDDDKSTVYMVESSCIEPFTKTLYDYAQMEDFPVISDTDNINKITVKGDKSYELSKNTDTNLWTVKGDGDEEKADTATVSSLTTSFGSMAYNSSFTLSSENPFSSFSVKIRALMDWMIHMRLSQLIIRKSRRIQILLIHQRIVQLKQQMRLRVRLRIVKIHQMIQMHRILKSQKKL